jgi:hypothetical protein
VKYPEAHLATAPVSESAWRYLQAALDEEVQGLPERLRVPFVLCCLEGRSQNDVAAELGCKVSTVSSWLTRARKQLLRRLARRDVSLSAAPFGRRALLGRRQHSAARAGAQSTLRAALAYAFGGLIVGPALPLVRAILRGMLLYCHGWNRARLGSPGSQHGMTVRQTAPSPRLLSSTRQ